MVTVHETEIDGALCFWADLGRPLSAAHLHFRHGLADEPLPETGWLHLLEHLALLDRETLRSPIQGSVGMLLTRFTAHGTPESVVDDLVALARWLEEPDLQLLARERGVLQAEAQRRIDPLLASLTWRYGATGPGVASYAEVGSLRATPELLAERSRRVFNRSNVVLVLDGPPPADLALPLPPGEYHAPAPAQQVDRPLPATYVDDAWLTLTGAVRRTHASSFLPGILERAVHDGMREHTGGVDSPWARLVDVDDRHSVVGGGSAAQRDAVVKSVETALEIAARLGRDGVPRDWLQEAVDNRLGELEHRDVGFLIAHRSALAVLSDRVPQTLEEMVDELRSTDPAEVDAAAREFNDTLLLGAPEHPIRRRDPVQLITFPERPPVGVVPRHRHVDWPADAATFAVDSQTVERASGTTARVMRVPDIVSVFAWRDGTRQLIGRDGSTLWMEPAEWRGGDDLTAQLDSWLPADLRVPVPDRPGTFQRMAPAHLAATATIRFTRTVAGQIVIAALCFLLGVVILSGGHTVVGGGLILVTLCLASRVTLVLRRAPAAATDQDELTPVASP
ncbi:hypothetical protein [Nocardioides cynanchi]|uniref:hypothetical protein n=1 Tax=Nocardioides cynanchi TaxID=2558918 RepID=UPI001247098F|nr:hypothetical protein [Nocardioides cynanchi]